METPAEWEGNRADAFSDTISNDELSLIAC